MKQKLTTLVLGLALSGVAQAAPVCTAEPINKISMHQMTELAADVCPRYFSPEQMKAVARSAGVTVRESNEMLALCAMYHLGRAHQIEHELGAR